jgi:hypothetical protein
MVFSRIRIFLTVRIRIIREPVLTNNAALEVGPHPPDEDLLLLHLLLLGRHCASAIFHRAYS